MHQAAIVVSAEYESGGHTARSIKWCHKLSKRTVSGSDKRDELLYKETHTSIRVKKPECKL